jgi:hypothetical protein
MKRTNVPTDAQYIRLARKTLEEDLKFKRINQVKSSHSGNYS